MYPMKIEYQNETFREIISEEFTSKKFDAYTFREQMRSEAKASQGVNEQFRAYMVDSFKNVGGLINNVLKKSPFSPNSQDYKKLRISLMLNALNSLKLKKRLDSEIPTIIL